MKFASTLLATGLTLSSLLQVIGNATPVSVVVTLRGKKYDIQGATSVADLQASVEEQAGLAKEQQSVLFKGSLLSSEEVLSEVGVSDGDIVNIVPGKKPKAAATATEVSADGEGDAVADGSGAGAADPFGMGGMGGLGGMMGGMGGLGGAGGMPPGVSMEQYEKMMTEMVNSDMMEEVLGDPEKMEQARQAIVDNPTLKTAMAQLPGFSEMIDSPEKWRENMEMALELFRAQKAMMQEQGGGAGAGGPVADVDDLDDE